ncbi:GTPase activator protein, partial [Oryctes borbonicus]
MLANMLLSQLSLELEILRYEISSDGKYLACIITCGRVNVYLLARYLSIPQAPSEEDKIGAKKRMSLKKSPQVIYDIKEKINGVLDNEKLRNILNEFSEFPEDYRAIIWARLLRLPNNHQLYNALINIKPKVPIADFEKKYPLENKMALKNLKKIISNLANWSPFFAEVDYLPEFAFPFVKVFKNDPVACFEAVCTIIANWCQYWFEYFPLPPVNILAIVENVLLEHKPQLLHHFAKYEITSKIYAWPLLQTAFSEVLTARDWLILWDHILINEPSFFLLAVVAYNLINSHVLLKMNYGRDIKRFFYTQNFLDIKKLISTTYELLNNTSEKNHPRQYLNYFTPIEIGEYPQFNGYPTAVHTIQDFKGLRKDKHLLTDKELEMLQPIDKGTKIDQVRKNIEENQRMNELGNLYKSKLEDELAIVNEQRKRLDELKKIKDLNLQKGTHRSLDHRHGRCYCTSLEGKHARLCDKAIIASDLKATDMLIKKVEKGLKKQKGGSLEDTDIQQLAVETVELEMKILKELQLLNSLKEVP